jgi:hypothetical protein
MGRSAFAVVFALVGLLVSGSVGTADGQTTGPPVGISCKKNRWSHLRMCAALGATLARVEFDVASPPGELARFMRAFTVKGIKVQPLAGFHGRVPTVQEAQNLRNWALRFGPGGTFWQGRSDGHLAVTHIEFGNETSYSYQYGEGGSWWLSSSYTARARTYAQRVKDASIALQGTGVGLLVQADDGGSSHPSWVDNMVAAVPDLGRYVAGWTIHPYGPGGFAKIDRMLSYLQAKGLPSTTPFYITEWGLASDNGRTLSDNYGYAPNMTYADAAATMRTVFARWRSSYGTRLAQAIIYQHADQQPSERSRQREHYFGLLKSTGGAKGELTATARRLLATGSAT